MQLTPPLHRLVLLAIGLSLTACTAAQINSVLNHGSTPPGGELTTSEISRGLKEALRVGIEQSTARASKTDGYYLNPEIKIPFPPEIIEVRNKLTQIGLDKSVDDFVRSMNRAAERAAAEALPVFAEAIRQMTIDDARNILMGGKHAATEYLKQATFDELQARYAPIVRESLDAVDATKYYTTVAGAYNSLPFVRKVETDLEEYVTRQALQGLFTLVAREEEKIREDPVARTTDLLRRVFGAS